MQRKVRKLSLHKETLRNLEQGVLRHAGAGSLPITKLCTTDACPVGESIDTPCAPTGPQLTCGPECA